MVSMDLIIKQVLAGARCGQLGEIRLLLHPYLHWTPSQGPTIRGRTKTLAFLAEHPIRPPEHVELRDGQIYRWDER